jgi:hypothetical protein
LWIDDPDMFRRENNPVEVSAELKSLQYIVMSAQASTDWFITHWSTKVGDRLMKQPSNETTLLMKQPLRFAHSQIALHPNLAGSSPILVGKASCRKNQE